MKTALLSMVFGVFLVGAQGEVQPSDGRIQATADAVMQDGNIFHLRGQVEIRQGPFVIMAERDNRPARVESTWSGAQEVFQGEGGVWV